MPQTVRNKSNVNPVTRFDFNCIASPGSKILEIGGGALSKLNGAESGIYQ